MSEQIDYNEIFQKARHDPSLFSNIDIDEILNKIDDENFIEDKTLTVLSEEIYNALLELNLDKELLAKYCEKLSGYRYVDKICELMMGRAVYWIKKYVNPPALVNGGIVTRIKIENNGVNFLCKKPHTNRFYSLRFDDCIVFQKLTVEEQLVIMSNDYI